MASLSRNRTLAKLAFAVAQSDGKVSPVEIKALERFLEVHPEHFSLDDRAEILAHAEDLQMRRDAFRRRVSSVDPIWLRSLSQTLLVDDAAVVIDLMLTVAEADRRVSPEEFELIATIREALSGAYAPAA